MSLNPKAEKIDKMMEPWVGLAALATIPMIFLESDMEPRSAFIANGAIWLVFTLHFFWVLLACQGAPERKSWVKSSVLDILIIIGSFPILPSSLQSLRLLRVGRATRILRFLRLGRVFALGWLLQWAKRKFTLNPLLFSANATLIAILIGANSIQILEPDLVPNLGSALWYAFATCSTVGYGDLTPVSDGGRAIGVLLMIIGVAMMASFSGALASYLTSQHNAEVDSELKEVLIELKSLRSEVQDLRSLLAAHRKG